MNEIEEYAVGLLVEEGSEIGQLVGKAMRFGLDTPGVKDPLTGVVDMTVTSRTRLNAECGDMLAAIDYAATRGVLNWADVERAWHEKIAKLLDPNAVDNLGRRLAP